MTLKAALEVMWGSSSNGEGDDGGITTAQLILEAAGITLPSGDLANGAYDPFGAKYDLPEYVVSYPENLAEDDEEADKRIESGDGTNEGDSDESVDEEERARRREEKGKAVIPEADLIKVKARLSDRGGPDVEVRVGKNESVRSLTRRVHEEAGLPPSTHIRIVYMGKILKESESLLSQNWKEDHIIQALVFDNINNN